MELRPSDPSMDDIYQFGGATAAGPGRTAVDRSAATIETTPVVVGLGDVGPAGDTNGRAAHPRIVHAIGERSRGRNGPQGGGGVGIGRDAPRPGPGSRGADAEGQQAAAPPSDAGPAGATCSRRGASRWWCTRRSSRRWPSRRSARRTRSSRRSTSTRRWRVTATASRRSRRSTPIPTTSSGTRRSATSTPTTPGEPTMMVVSEGGGEGDGEDSGGVIVAGGAGHRPAVGHAEGPRRRQGQDQRGLQPARRQDRRPGAAPR